MRKKKELFFLIILTGLIGLFVYGMIESPIFRVKGILIKGCNRVDADEILRLSGLKKGISLFMIDPDDIKQKIISNIWVKDVMIKKIFPHLIEINIEEKIPQAVLLLDKSYLVDEDGEIIKEVELPANGYPIIIGLQERDFKENKALCLKLVKGAIKLAKIIEEKRVCEICPIKSIHIDKVFGYGLMAADSSLSIKLGFSQMDQKIERLLYVLKDLQRRDQKATLINLKFPYKAYVTISTKKGGEINEG